MTSLLLAALVLGATQFQESVMPMPTRMPLPRPAAGASLAQVNDNRRPAGTLSPGTLTLTLDIVEAGYQPEGEHDPVVRILACGVVQWKPLARDGADLPMALRAAVPAVITMGPGETADFVYLPARAGTLLLEVWIDGGQRVELPVKVVAR